MIALELQAVSHGSHNTSLYSTTEKQYCGVLSTAIIVHCALYKLKGVATVLNVYIRTAPARMLTA